MVGPAGLTTRKEIKHLSFSETIGIPDVSPCLSQFIVSVAADKKLDFEPLEHSVYSGRRRLGRYVRIRQGDTRLMTLTIACWVTLRSAKTLGPLLP